MDKFLYLSVLPSIIVGLAITQVLQGFRGLLQARKRVRLYWPVLALAVLLLVVYVQTWWAMFALHAHQDWKFFAFAIVLFQNIVLYMLAGLVLPDFPADQSVDLQTHYYANHRWFFGLAVVVGFVSIGEALAVGDSLPKTEALVFQIVFIAVAAVAAITRRRWYHEVAVPVIIGLFGLFIALFYNILR